MVGEIGSALRQKWTMPYIIWLLNYHGGLTEHEVSNLIGLIGKFHMDSPLLGEFCISLAPAGKSNSQPAQASIGWEIGEPYYRENSIYRINHQQQTQQTIARPGMPRLVRSLGFDGG